MNSLVLRLTYLVLATAPLLMAPPMLKGQTATLDGGDAETPALRDLVCRGRVNPSPVWGISTLRLEVVQDPSDDSPVGRHYVKMKMTYEPHGTRPPGSCYWHTSLPGGSPPPGVVYFDLEAVARTAPGEQASAPVYVDTASFRRYLSDPNHLWIFYHMHPSPTGFDSPSAQVHAPILDPPAIGIDLTPTSPTDRTIGASTRERRAQEPGRYVAFAGEALSGGERYYFVITVPAGAAGGKAQQYKGEFTTRW